jgi:hypothetical protein
MTQHSADDHELLTPAASEVLSEFTEDFRRSLLRRAAVAARRSGSNEITVSDVARAYESEQRSADSYSQRRSRFVALLGVYAALGVAIAAGSGVVLLIRATDSASSTDRLAAIGAVVGVFVASLSAVGTISIRRLRLGGLELSSYPLRDVEGDFIRAWASFEIDA